MFNLENAITNWKRQLRGNPAFEDGDIAELESHLREEIERLKAERFSEEEVFHKATEEIGKPEPIGNELYKSRATQKAGPVPPWKQASWMPSMLPNYLKVSLRNLKRNRIYSSINIFGLAVGIGCCLLILLYIQYHLNFDTHYQQPDRIYRLTGEVISESGDQIRNMVYVPGSWGPGFVDELPDIKAYARFFRYRADIIVNRENSDHRFFEPNFYWADSTVFSVFGYPLVRGNTLQALNRPNTVVISETIARKYFGDEDPIGGTLNYINADAIISLEVTGVMTDVPAQSHFHPEFIASVSTIADRWWIQDYDRMDSWENPFWVTYLTVDGNKDAGILQQEINRLLDRRLGEASSRYEAFLQPVDHIHLYSKLIGEFEENGDISYLYGLGTIALFILLIACINFMNLATARAAKRMKEVGVRKALGSNRKQLMGQFFGESLLMSALAFGLGLTITELLRPFLNAFTGDLMANQYLSSSWFWMSGIGLILVVGLVAGSYPALYLSGFKPTEVLKNQVAGLQKGEWFRKGLVIGQFAVSVFLLISTLVVFRQINYVQNKKLGFDKEYQITIPLRGQGLQSQFEALKESIKQSPYVLAAAAASKVMMEGGHSYPIYLPDLRSRENPVHWEYLHTDHDYPEAIGIELVAGRFPSREFASDSSAGILNESAVRALGMSNEEVLGTRIQNDWGVDGRVVGVAKDFHYVSLHEHINPFTLLVNYEFGVRFINIKISSQNLQETIGHIREQWNRFSPGTPFSYTFLNEEIDRLYRTEQKQGRLFANFTILAIMISCLGLFGLAAFMAERRTREIGIRKVLGASISSIVNLLSKDFLKQVVLGFFVGAPLAWFGMNAWLQNFAYRIQIGADLILVAGLLTAIVALGTVSWKSIRSALMNPVKSLRSE